MTLRLVPILPLAIVLLAGCDDTPPPATPGVGPGASRTEPKPAPPPAPDIGKPREILGKKTMDVRDAQKEMKTGGAIQAPSRPIAREPITLAGNVYVSAIGQTSVNNIKHAMDLYQAETGAFPKDYPEFIEQIIKKNNIALPTLPYYQEYAYDAPNHKLIILEYPDKKAAGDARRP